MSYAMLIDGARVMHMKGTTRLSAKFQISIPKAVRVAQGWRAGQNFAFIPRGEAVMLVPVPVLADLAGSVPGANTQHYRDRTDRA